MDTALLYGHPRGPPMKPSLKNLSKAYLDKTIQEGAHDSIIDADTAMKLAKLKLNQGLDFGHPTLSDSEKTKLFDLLNNSKKSIAYFDEAHWIKRVNIIICFKFQT